MNRHHNCPALVLSVRPFGESHREAAFLTPAEGIVRATVYGGPKSKLRAYVAPFQTGTLYLYRAAPHAGAGGGAKVSDFDVSAWRPEIRELLERAWAAAFIAGALVRGAGGGGESADAFNLANASLDALVSADAVLCEKIRVHFLWNWLDVLGIRPEATPAVDAGALRYLELTGGLAPATLERYSLDAGSFMRLAAFLDGYWRETAGEGARIEL